MHNTNIAVGDKVTHAVYPHDTWQVVEIYTDEQLEAWGYQHSYRFSIKSIAGPHEGHTMIGIEQLIKPA